jgi:hypothetical protein
MRFFAELLPTSKVANHSFDGSPVFLKQADYKLGIFCFMAVPIFLNAREAFGFFSGKINFWGFL